MKEDTGRILIVDDDETVRTSIIYYLEDNGFDVDEADNGNSGLEKIKENRYDLILSDLRMPGMGGLDLLQKSKEINSQTPFIMVSGIKDIEEALDAIHRGATDYMTKPIYPLSILGYTIDRVLEKERLKKENREYQEHLEQMVKERTKKLEEQNIELRMSRRQVVGILSQAAEYRDFETGAHFLRVSQVSALLAQALGKEKDFITAIQLASPVHDIGKIGIADEILLKTTRLNQDEWEEMKKHCIYGHDILKAGKFVESFLKIDQLDDKVNKCSFEVPMITYASNIALYHHEHWDGTGYPYGLKGNDIPLEARITSVADVFDALSSKRPYKKAWNSDESLKYILKNSGTQFDPEIVEAFNQIYTDIFDIMEKIGD